MAITSSCTLTMSVSDGINGNTALQKQIPGSSLSFTGSVETYVQSQLVGSAAPTAAPTCTPGTGGSMAAGNYLVKVTYVNAPQGETTPSPESTSQTVAASGTLTVNSPPASAPASAYNVYMTAAGGASGTETKQNSSPIPIGTNYVQTAAVTAGSALPGSNTTLTLTPVLTIIPLQFVYVRNISTSIVVSLSWTPQGGSSNKVLDLVPNAAIVAVEPTAGTALGGITAWSVTAASPGASIEWLWTG